MQWQSGIGPVYIYRPNGEGDFKAHDLDVIHEYTSMLLEGFGEYEFNPKEHINPDTFLEFVREQQSACEDLLDDLTMLKDGTIDREMAEWAATMLWQR